VPCPLHALLTPRGSVTFRTTIRPRNLHPLKATQSPICTTQSRPMAGHKSQRRNPHAVSPKPEAGTSAGQARCKTGNATIPGHSIEPSSSPPPQARPPKVTFYVCRAFGRFARGSSFHSAEGSIFTVALFVTAGQESGPCGRERTNYRSAQATATRQSEDEGSNT